eukprot:4522649-Pyramimonas_sp.AAC.1
MGKGRKKSKKSKKDGMDEVAKDFKEADSGMDKEERRRVQTQTLEAMFECYFRILKQGECYISVTYVLHKCYIRVQTQTLEAMFECYFRILKQVMPKTSERQQRLGDRKARVCSRRPNPDVEMTYV